MPKKKSNKEQPAHFAAIAAMRMAAEKIDGDRSVTVVTDCHRQVISVCWHNPPKRTTVNISAEAARATVKAIARVLGKEGK